MVDNSEDAEATLQEEEKAQRLIMEQMAEIERQNQLIEDEKRKRDSQGESNGNHNQSEEEQALMEQLAEIEKQNKMIEDEAKRREIAAKEEAAAAEKARQEAEAAEKAEQERIAAEKAEQEILEQERIAAEKAEQERLEQERIAAEKAEQERLEQERIAAEKAEQERLEQERIAAEKAEQERVEQERIATEKAEQERLDQERIAAEKAEHERLEQERIAAEKAEQERLEQERIAAEMAEQERLEEAEKVRLADEEYKLLEQAAAEAELEANMAEGNNDNDDGDMSKDSEPENIPGSSNLEDDTDKLVEEMRKEMENFGQNSAIASENSDKPKEEEEMEIDFLGSDVKLEDLQTPPSSARDISTKSSPSKSKQKPEKIEVKKPKPAASSPKRANPNPTTPPRLPRVASLASPSSKVRQPEPSPRSNSSRSPKYTPPSKSHHTPVRNTLPRVLSPRDAPRCPTDYNPDLHGSKGPCERCLFYASEEEKEKFKITGHHIRIMICNGGCDRSCLIYPRDESEPPVRLCKKCYFDTHRTRYDVVPGPLKSTV